jgi:hypothetical protein
MDGRELRQLLEQHSPGPRLVPGSDALHGASAAAALVRAEPPADAAKPQVAE